MKDIDDRHLRGVVILTAIVGQLIAVQVQVGLGFELEVAAAHKRLKDTALPGPGIGVEEDQQLFVQIPGREPESG